MELTEFLVNGRIAGLHLGMTREALEAVRPGIQWVEGTGPEIAISNTEEFEIHLHRDLVHGFVIRPRYLPHPYLLDAQGQRHPLTHHMTLERCLRLLNRLGFAWQFWPSYTFHDQVCIRTAGDVDLLFGMHERLTLGKIGHWQSIS